MSPEINILLTSLIPLSLGLVIGIVLKRPSAKSSVLNGSNSDIKLKNELLTDQIKQLEAKVKTLEKALEMTSKN